MGYTPPTLYVTKISGGWQLTGPTTTTTDDLTILPNAIDTDSKIVMMGNGAIYFRYYNSDASAFYFNRGTTQFLSLGYITPDIIFTGLADKNIFLNTAGTGVVKFGTYTAGPATDSTGYITIQDSAGNTRKLMVQA